MKQKLTICIGFIVIALSISTLTRHDSPRTVHAQSNPVTQCNMSVTFTASGTTPATGTNSFDNTLNSAQCNTWVMTAYATGFTGMTVQLEGAGPAASFSAVTASGGTTNPCNTITGCVVQCLCMFNTLRINITSVTGAGTIFVRLNGAVGVTAKVGNGSGATGPAGGDLSGTYPNPTVIAANGGAFPTSAGMLGTNASKQPIAQTPGGDLSGTYPSPTVAQVNGAAVPTSAGMIGTNASKQLISQTPGGDLSGTYPSPTVAKVNGTSVPINSSADQIINTTGSAIGQWTSVPNCTDTAGNHLNYATSTHTLSCGTTASVQSGNGVTNTTPVTTSGGSVTTDQAMMELALSAGFLNTLNQGFEFVGAGVYTLPAAQTPLITVKIKLCTVSGCGSGTVVTLVSIQTTAATASVTNNNWEIRAVGVTHTAGATGNLEIHGPLSIDLGALITTADSIFQDTNTAVSSNIDLTAALFVDYTVAFSTANASNVMTEREAGVFPYVASSGGGAGAMTQISQTVLGSAATSITFSSIPATYNDLLLTVQGRGDTAAQRITVNMQFNADAGANYEWETVDAHSTSVSGTQVTATTSIGIGVLPAASNTANYPGQIDIKVINYKRTTFNKTVHSIGALRYDNGPTIGFQSFGGNWNNTAAITQILLAASAGNFLTGTTATLWGIN